MGGDGSGTPAVGNIGDPSHQRRSDADAGARGSDDSVRFDLSRARGHRRRGHRVTRSGDGVIELRTLGLPEAIAAIIGIALNAYVLTGGADFGGGIWDLFATGPRRVLQRELIPHAIEPIWG